jgi:hypothetical protein
MADAVPAWFKFYQRTDTVVAVADSWPPPAHPITATTDHKGQQEPQYVRPALLLPPPGLVQLGARIPRKRPSYDLTALPRPSIEAEVAKIFMLPAAAIVALLTRDPWTSLQKAPRSTVPTVESTPYDQNMLTNQWIGAEN